MITSTVEFPANGGTASGYVARPEADGLYMGVVVIQEWWGLNSHIQDVTRRVAGAGAVAIAPDLYHGRVATEPDEARKLRMALDMDTAVKEIDGAVALLKGQSQVLPKKIGIVGFCLGGGLAQHAGARNADVAAVVAFYGGHPPAPEAFANRAVHVLSIVGEDDESVLENQRALADGLRGSGVDFELRTYPGCGHAFFNDTRLEAYEPAAAQDAWARTIEWLRTHLQAD